MQICLKIAAKDKKHKSIFFIFSKLVFETFRHSLESEHLWALSRHEHHKRFQIFASFIRFYDIIIVYRSGEC
jgi:hypothetical protein